MTPNAIERTLRLAAPPERVWRALTDPRELASWFPDEAADVDVSVGAGGWLSWANHGRYAVRFEVVEPPSRLVWTWARNRDTAVDDGPRTTVEWRLEAAPGGGTTLTLRESGFADPEHREQNSGGWDRELEELRDWVEAEAPARRL